VVGSEELEVLLVLPVEQVEMLLVVDPQLPEDRVERWHPQDGASDEVRPYPAVGPREEGPEGSGVGQGEDGDEGEDR
jgi:hypothetical protein